MSADLGKEFAVQEPGTSVDKARTSAHEEDPRKVDSPQDLHKPSWKYTFKRAVSEFSHDQCTDQAAALTYYAVQALFPALVALVSLLGVLGQGKAIADELLTMLRTAGQQDAAATLEGPLNQMTQSNGAGLGLIIGIAGALWSASAFVGAFSRAMNRMYEVDEGRPIWKLRPQQLLLTTFLVILAGLTLLALVISGPVAQAMGDALSMGDTAMTVWNIAKWPVVLFMFVLAVAVLYYATPNVRQPRFQWISVGALIAIVTWVVSSALFGFYVANFGKYNKTYGSLAGIIVFLLWLWLTNMALLFGAEIDSELERSRQLQSGIKAEETLQLPPRDTRKSEKTEAKREKIIAEGQEIREAAEDSPDEDNEKPKDADS